MTTTPHLRCAWCHPTLPMHATQSAVHPLTFPPTQSASHPSTDPVTHPPTYPPAHLRRLFRQHYSPCVHSCVSLCRPALWLPAAGCRRLLRPLQVELNLSLFDPDQRCTNVAMQVPPRAASRCRGCAELRCLIALLLPGPPGARGGPGAGGTGAGGRVRGRGFVAASAAFA